MSKINLTPQKPLHYHKALEKKTVKVSGEYLVTEKMDGWYLEADYDAETGLWTPFRSFSQRIVPAFEHRNLNRLKLHPAQSCRVIVEATIPDIPFHIANGIFNRKQEQATDAVLWMHDLIHLSRAVTAVERFKQVQRVYEQCKFKLVPVLGVTNQHEEFLRFFDSVVERGGEGTVMKRLSGIYTMSGRNEDLLKMKAEITKDLLCVGVEHTVGKKGEPSVNLILRNKAGQDIPVVVPKDSDQIAWGNNHSLVLDKVCEVVALRSLENGKLREPRFKVIRQDKTVNDID